MPQKARQMSRLPISVKGVSNMRPVDTFPTNQYKGLEYRVGRVFPFGASFVEDNGVNFSIFSREATGCSLLLFHHGDKNPTPRFRFPRNSGSVMSSP
jgi:pullulanase/glycogen debranching enzyme